MATTITISFKPDQTVKRLVDVIDNERTRDVLLRRYGLKKAPTPETLEAVGQSYGITRERVRQIENQALRLIQKSDEYRARAQEFTELAEALKRLGGVATQDEILATLARNERERNYLLFLLSVGEHFNRAKEGGDFVHHWYLDESQARNVREALRTLYAALDDAIVLPEEEMLSLYRTELEKRQQEARDEELLRRWLRLSKKIAPNPLGEWGRATSPSVRVKGMRDFAYLALKRHGSPMHFSEVAQRVEELFGKKAHIATTHNELIKDSRFVLVGRGLYALAEWGYAQGVVKDVIREILKKHGPLTKQEIVERVKRERYVKDNTIAVNLQDHTTFARLDDGRYELA